MASIRAVLKINENGNGVIESVTSNVETRNISELPYTTDLTSWFLNQTEDNQTYPGARFDVLGIPSSAILGTMKYGVESNNYYSNQYKGLVFAPPYLLQNDLTITIVGTDVIAFKIHFDTTEGQSPTSYTVYSSISGETETYSSVTDGIIDVENLLAGHGTTVITITSWAEQNKPIGIIYFENVEMDIFMDKYWIDTFETQTQQTSDGEAIQFGVLANTGSITLKDKDQKLLKTSQKGYLGVYLFTLDLYVNNRVLQSHISNSAPYFTDNFTMRFDLTNDVEKFQNKYISNTFEAGFYTAFDILSEIFTGFDFRLKFEDMLVWTSNGNQNESTAWLLTNFFVDEDLTLEGSVLDIANKICEAFGLNMYFNDDGTRLIVAGARPRKINTESIINIPYEKQYSDFDYSILTINRYDRVFFDDETTVQNYKNAVTLKTNEFFELTNHSIASDTVEKTLKESILEDYADGIKIAQISVFPSNLYTTSGVQAKNWNLGEILEVGDIVRVESKDGGNALYDKNHNEVYWRVIDRKTKYEGQILMDLVLREIKN